MFGISDDGARRIQLSNHRVCVKKVDHNSPNNVNSTSTNSYNTSSQKYTGCNW